MSETYKHYSEYSGPWPWRNFRPAEAACRHCGELYLDPDSLTGSASLSLDALQRLRELWAEPVLINSGHRCALHNAAVGGTANSQHLRLAFDCRCQAVDQAAFIAAAVRAGFAGIGRYPGKGFVHLDLGPRRSWAG